MFVLDRGGRCAMAGYIGAIRGGGGIATSTDLIHVGVGNRCPEHDVGKYLTELDRGGFRESIGRHGYAVGCVFSTQCAHIRIAIFLGQFLANRFACDNSGRSEEQTSELQSLMRISYD